MRHLPRNLPDEELLELGFVFQGPTQIAISGSESDEEKDSSGRAAPKEADYLLERWWKRNQGTKGETAAKKQGQN